MGPCVESCMKSGALSPSLRDGDARISIRGPAGRSVGAVPARIASKFLDFSAPYSCWDNIAVHRPSMQIRCTSVWLFRWAYLCKVLHRDAPVKGFVGQSFANCGVIPYRPTATVLRTQ